MYDEAEADPYEEDPWKEDKANYQQNDYYSDEDIEQKKEFKTYRKVLFNVWRIIKGAFWFVGAWFLYHYYRVVYSKRPE